MHQDYAIKTIHHNRCVVIPIEQLVQAGITKGDYVSLRVEGSKVVIEKAHLCPFSAPRICSVCDASQTK